MILVSVIGGVRLKDFGSTIRTSRICSSCIYNRDMGSSGSNGGAAFSSLSSRGLPYLGLELETARRKARRSCGRYLTTRSHISVDNVERLWVLEQRGAGLSCGQKNAVPIVCADSIQEHGECEEGRYAMVPRVMMGKVMTMSSELSSVDEIIFKHKNEQ